MWWVEFNPQVGHEQAVRRPAIVVGTELACQIPNRLALVVPCTQTDRDLPWHPQVTLGDDRGVAMCDQVKAIDRRRLQRQHRCGVLADPEEREAVARALRELVTVET